MLGCGCQRRTIRYYQRRQLLAQPERLPSAIGRYPPDALTRLRFIKRSQSLGFSLDNMQAAVPGRWSILAARRRK
ncbi:MAG: MerR family transcriptional regulator [Caldimonas sp.]